MPRANVELRMTGDEKRLVRSLKRSQKEVDRLTERLRASGRAGKVAGGKIQRAVGANLVGALKMAAGAGGAGLLAVALRGLVRLAGEVKQEIIGVVKELKEAEETLKYLWQISGGKREYEKLSGEMRLAVATEGMTRQEGGKLGYILSSLGAYEAFFQVVKAKRFMEPDVAADFYARLTAPAAYGKQWKPEQVLAGLIEGARVSAFNVGETAGWVPRTIAGMRPLAAKPEEILGVGATISALTPNPQILATWMDAMAREIDKAGFGGKGILGGLRAWRAEDPESYAEKKKSEQRFKRAALAMEGMTASFGPFGMPYVATAMQQAEQFTKMTAEQFRTGQRYFEKIDTPAELGKLAASREAEAQRSVSLEPKAFEQMQLETTINRMEALAGFTGTSLVVERGWEKLAQGAATVGAVKFATEKARERYLDRILEAYPDLYKEHIEPVFPGAKVEAHGPFMSSRARERFGGVTHPFTGKWLPGWRADVPRDLSEEQLAAIRDLAKAIAAQNIGERFSLGAGGGNLTEAATELNRAAEKLNTAADKIDRATATKPTLGHPDEEPP